MKTRVIVSETRAFQNVRANIQAVQVGGDGGLCKLRMRGVTKEGKFRETNAQSVEYRTYISACPFKVGSEMSEKWDPSE